MQEIGTSQQTIYQLNISSRLNMEDKDEWSIYWSFAL